MRRPKQGAAWTTSFEKRAFDVAVATALLPAAALVIGALSAKIATEDKMSPFFFQTRYTRGFRPFKMVKLQTMLPGCGETTAVHVGRDPRATELGDKLRDSHADEGPQLVNVLSGKMSLFGFRPPILQEIRDTWEVLNKTERREWRYAVNHQKAGIVSRYNLKLYEGEQREHDLRERALDTIDYGFNGTRDMDVRILQQAATLGYGVLGSFVDDQIERYIGDLDEVPAFSLGSVSAHGIDATILPLSAFNHTQEIEVPEMAGV